MNNKYFWYSIYLNFISLLICFLCIFFSFIIKKYILVSILLSLMVIGEMILNVVNYHNLKLENPLTKKIK